MNVSDSRGSMGSVFRRCTVAAVSADSPDDDEGEGDDRDADAGAFGAVRADEGSPVPAGS